MVFDLESGMETVQEFDTAQLVDMVSFQEFDMELLVDKEQLADMELPVDKESFLNMATVQELCAD